MNMNQEVVQVAGAAVVGEALPVLPSAWRDIFSKRMTQSDIERYCLKIPKTHGLDMMRRVAGETAAVTQKVDVQFVDHEDTTWILGFSRRDGGFVLGKNWKGFAQAKDLSTDSILTFEVRDIDEASILRLPRFRILIQQPANSIANANAGGGGVAMVEPAGVVPPQPVLPSAWRDFFSKTMTKSDIERYCLKIPKTHGMDMMRRVAGEAAAVTQKVDVHFVDHEDTTWILGFSRRDGGFVLGKNWKGFALVKGLSTDSILTFEVRDIDEASVLRLPRFRILIQPAAAVDGNPNAALPIIANAGDMPNIANAGDMPGNLRLFGVDIQLGSKKQGSNMNSYTAFKSKDQFMGNNPSLNITMGILLMLESQYKHLVSTTQASAKNICL